MGRILGGTSRSVDLSKLKFETAKDLRLPRLWLLMRDVIMAPWGVPLPEGCREKKKGWCAPNSSRTPICPSLAPSALREVPGDGQPARSEDGTTARAKKEKGTKIF